MGDGKRAAKAMDDYLRSRPAVKQPVTAVSDAASVLPAFGVVEVTDASSSLMRLTEAIQRLQLRSLPVTCRMQPAAPSPRLPASSARACECRGLQGYSRLQVAS